MKSVREKEMERFRAWLTSQGAEIHQPTNEYEFIRFRCRFGVGVVYRKSNGNFSYSSPWVSEAFATMMGDKPWSGKGKPGKRKGGSTRKRQLFDRDGDDCFYCGKPMGADMTIEHLLSINHGGPDRFENTVLAHQQCNLRAGSLPIIDKIILRDKMRAGEIR